MIVYFKNQEDDIFPNCSNRRFHMPNKWEKNLMKMCWSYLFHPLFNQYDIALCMFSEIIVVCIL